LAAVGADVGRDLCVLACAAGMAPRDTLAQTVLAATMT
jgi:hypothetical protein